MRKLTGQDIHAAFVAAHHDENKPPLVDFIAQWEQIPEASRNLYTKMADYLNEQRQEENRLYHARLKGTGEGTFLRAESNRAATEVACQKWNALPDDVVTVLWSKEAC